MATRTTKRDLAELASGNPRKKYRRAKECVAIARTHPRQLYPYLGFFVDLMRNDNNILKWTAIDVVGYLSQVNTGRQVRQCLTCLSAFLSGGKLISANHAIGALSHVALARPKYQDRITQELLSVECYSYETDECRNIVLGKVIDAFGSLLDHVYANVQVLGFVSRQLKNSRAGTRKKAERFLRSVERATGGGRRADSGLRFS